MSYETEPNADKLDFLIEDTRSLEQRFASVDRYTAGVLERAVEGTRPDVEEGTHLLGLRGNDLSALVAAADHCRREDVGDVVTYVVNRNINWTNICFVGCKFCAFAHLKGDAEAYDVPMETLLGKVAEAIERGATEVCMQGGINPELPADGYFKIIEAVHEAFPDIHIHAYSPMEIMYGARRAAMSYTDYIGHLKDLGLGSMPGTAAEILDDEVREILSHKKLDVATWVEIITTAHRLGLPTTSTVMYGHIETPGHVARHIDLLRSIQEQTGGFTEFVPLRFIWQNTVLYREGRVQPVPQGETDLAIYATSKLMLRGLIDNLQTSWVKIGHQLATLTLMAGCNDLGGTLMEESISREAGADAGEYTSVDELEAMIRRAGRTPRQRNTLYGTIEPPEGPDEQIYDLHEQSHASSGWSGSGKAPAGAGGSS